MPGIRSPSSVKQFSAMRPAALTEGRPGSWRSRPWGPRRLVSPVPSVPTTRRVAGLGTPGPRESDPVAAPSGGPGAGLASRALGRTRPGSSLPVPARRRRSIGALGCCGLRTHSAADVAGQGPVGSAAEPPESPEPLLGDLSPSGHSQTAAPTTTSRTAAPAAAYRAARECTSRGSQRRPAPPSPDGTVTLTAYLVLSDRGAQTHDAGVEAGLLRRRGLQTKSPVVGLAELEPGRRGAGVRDQQQRRAVQLDVPVAAPVSSVVRSTTDGEMRKVATDEGISGRIGDVAVCRRRPRSTSSARRSGRRRGRGRRGAHGTWRPVQTGLVTAGRP